MPYIITSKAKGGHYRAGVHHKDSPVEWLDDAFSQEELAKLMADPRVHLVLSVPAGQTEPPAEPVEPAEPPAETPAAPAPAEKPAEPAKPNKPNKAKK